MRSIALTLALLLSGCAHAGRKAPEPSRFPAGAIPIVEIDADALVPVLDKAKERVAAGDRTLLFRISSFGGEVFSGLDFITAVEDLKKQKVVHVMCVVDTRAMSMAAVFLESFCDERLMTGRSQILFHNSSSQLRGTAKQLEAELAFMRALDLSMAAIVSGRIGMPLADYQARIDGKNWTLAWQEALELHVVDEVIDASVLPPAYVLADPKPDLSKLLGL